MGLRGWDRRGSEDPAELPPSLVALDQPPPVQTHPQPTSIMPDQTLGGSDGTHLITNSMLSWPLTDRVACERAGRKRGFALCPPAGNDLVASDGPQPSPPRSHPPSHPDLPSPRLWKLCRINVRSLVPLSIRTSRRSARRIRRRSFNLCPSPLPSLVRPSVRHAS